MAYHIVGLDIGSRNVRAVLLERSFRGYEIAEARSTSIPQGDNGEAPTVGAVAEAVQEIIGDLAQGQTSVVCSYPLERASVWFFTMPFNDPRRVAQTVAFEVEDMVPFDLDDMLFVYRIVKADAGSSQIMATLAPRKDVGARLQTLSEMSQDPLALVLDAHALINAVPGRSGQSRAVVDVGHRRTVVSVADGDCLQFVQVLPVGGFSVTRALMDRWHLPFEVAEHLKHHRVLPAGFEPRGSLPIEEESLGDVSGGNGASSHAPIADSELTLDGSAVAGVEEGGDEQADVTTLSWQHLDDMDTAPDINTLGDVDFAAVAFEDETTPGPIPPVPVAPPVGMEPISPENVARAISEATQESLGPIRAALIAFEAGQNREISQVHLVGGGARLPELAHALSEDLGVAVGPAERLGQDHVSLPGATSPSSYALAFALGLRGVTDGKLREIDFRREEFASRGNIHRLRVGMAMAVAAVALLALVGGVLGALEYRSLIKKVDDLDAQIATLVQESVPGAAPIKSAEQALVILTDERMALQERAKILGVADDQAPTALRTLKEVSDYLSPSEPGEADFLKVDIDEYQAGEGVLKLKGFTDSYESTGKVEASLGKSPLFTDVTSDASVDRRKEDRLNFTMTMTVVSEDVDLSDPS